MGIPMFASHHGESEGKTDIAVPHSGGSFNFDAGLMGGDHASGIVIPGAHLLFSGDFKRAGPDLILSDSEQRFVVHDYFKSEQHPTLMSPDGANLSGKVVDALTGYVDFAQAGRGTGAAKIIGTVVKLTGSATAIRNGVALELNIGDKVHKGDVVQSGNDSALGISFIDGTAFSLSSNARMVLNDMVYDPSGSSNSSLLSLVQGTISFVAGETAKNGNMSVDTPVATMGIRGTAVLVEISADNGPTKFSVLVEPGGRSGSYTLTDKITGLPVGTISQPGLVTFVSATGINQPLTIVESPKTATDLLNEREVVKLAFSIAFPQFNFDETKSTKFALGSSVNNLADIGTPSGATEGPTFTVTVPGVSKDKGSALGADHATDEVFFLHALSSSNSSSNNATLVEDSVGINLNLSTAGTIAFPNPIGTLSATIALKSSTSNPHLPGYIDNVSQIGTFAVSEITTPTGNTAAVGWSFTLADNNPVLQSLAQGETITQVYTITVRDNSGALLTQDVTVTLVGTNDTPIITSADLHGTVTEQPAPAGNLTDSGGVSFTDVDLIDVHLVSATGTPIGYTLGTLTAVKDSDTTGTGTGGHLIWTYTVADSAIEYLAAGQIKVESFTITIDDQHGGLITKQIDITITGTNDAAVISGTSSGIVEIDDDIVVSGTPVATGTLTDTDVDNPSNTFIAAAAGSATDHGYGTYQMTAAGVWTYTLDNSNSAVRALNDGEHLTDTFTVTTVDGTTQVVTVTISDDDPVIAVGPVSGVEGSPIPLNLSLKVSQSDLNSLLISNVPIGAILTDGHGNTFTASAGNTSVDVATWTLSGLSVTPTNDTNFSLTFLASGSSGLATTASEPITDRPLVPTISWSSGSFSEQPSQNIALPNLTVTVNGLPGESNSVSSLTLLGVPAGQIITDGGHNHISTGPADPFNYVGWNFNNFHLDPNGQTAAFTITAAATSVDAEGNLSTSSSALLSVTDPAGVAGSEINLGLAAASIDPGSLVAVTVADLPFGWSLNTGVQVDNHTWTVQTSDVQSLTVTTPSASVGAVVLEVSENWTKPDGGTASSLVFDNVESYAVAAPIFALAANDQLTGSSGADQFVFAKPISHDVIYSFDAASDKIDLVDFSGFSSFSDVAAHLSDDGAGNAVLTLASEETITLQGVNSASLSASNFQFDQQAVLENSADMIIGNGARLPLSGIIENTGAIELNSTGGETNLQLSQNGATLQGGGQIVLSDSAANIISGTGSVTLNNEDNTISGAGELGSGKLSLTNAGAINATGTHALTIDTGSNVVFNSGILEASGGGGLTVASSIANSGALWANGASLTVIGELRGNGTAMIDGAGTLEFESSSAANVAFGSSAAGTLKLGDSFHFKGTISGFDSSDRIDLVNVQFGTASIGYHESAAGTGGTLTISDGAQTAELSLLGHYSVDNFSVVTDQAKGTSIIYLSHDLVV
jgi:VCBS repeat-containing protein